MVVEVWLDMEDAPFGASAFCSLELVDCEPSALVLLELALELGPLVPFE